MIDRTRNVVQFPTVTRAEQPKRSTWSRLCSLPDDLDTALVRLHEHPYQPATAADDDDDDEQWPAPLAQETALYATVHTGDREVWHQVVAWQRRGAALVPWLAVVDEQVIRCSVPAFAYLGRQRLCFHPELPSRHVGEVVRLVS